MKPNNRAAGSRVVLYARVSTEEQAGEDHFSIEAQINEMREAAAKYEWEVVGEFVDEGVSGTLRDRPQLEIVLDMVSRKACDIVLVHELSRLSRSVYHTLDIFEILGKHGVGFASVRDPDFDFADPGKRLFLTIIAAINEYFIVLLRDHTSKAKRERARQGLYNASITPFGYEHVGGPKDPPVIIEEEAKVIRMAFEQYATGQYSDIEIAELLNQNGYKTRSGRRFSKDTISTILRNPFFAGKVLYSNKDAGENEVFEGQHEPLISMELWERCQTWRESRRTMSRSVQKQFRIYLLSNLATCDVCGRKLRAQSSTSGTYYREMSYERGFTDCPHQRIGIRTDPIDKQIHALIPMIDLPREWLDEVENRVGDDEETIALQRQRDRLEAELRRLQQMRLAGDFDDNMDFYRSELARIRRQLNSLPTFDQITSLRNTMRSIGNLHEIWDEAEPADQRDLLRLMLNDVSLDVRSGRIASISPLAVFLPIFRQIPGLHESAFGTFTPLWQPDQIADILPIPKIETMRVPLPEPIGLLPFTDRHPLHSSQKKRMTPAISKARDLASKNGPVYLATQIETAGWPEFPMDVRRWPETEGETISLETLLTRAPESSDVLVSQGLLWENALAKDQLTEERVAKVGEKLSQTGVWYLVEPLPIDAPANWVLRFFPAVGEWAKINAWNLHNLYMLFQRLGFSGNFKRHIYSQPVTLGAIKEIANQRPGHLALISERAVENGLDTIQQMIDEHGPKHVVYSEFSLLEAWIQKLKQETK